MPEKISILKESGEILNSNIVSIFSIPETEKKYIITTENAVDPHGLTVFHVSEIVGEDLVKIGTDEEWSTIKTIMRAIISGNVGPYQYQPVIEKATAKGQYSRDISVSSSAATQMSTSYVNANKNLEGQESSANSIFPIDSVRPTEENEVIPGVAEVDKASSSDPSFDASSAIPVEASINNENAVVDETGDTGVTNINVVPIAEENTTQLENQNNPQNAISPIAQQNTEEAVSTEESSMENISSSRVVSTPVVVTEENPVEDLAKKDLKISPVEAVNVEVQPSSDVAPTIPNSQIVQTNTNVMSINFGDISGAKNIDEIVETTTKAFSESLRNILHMVTGINSSLSEKEARLNEREELIIQREKMINDQLMSMMNNFSSIQQMNSSQGDNSTNQSN